MSSSLPRQLDHYELLELLAEGGTGHVYRARDTRMQRAVAVKILNPQAVRDPKDAARFQREVRLAAALRHPNVLTVYDCSPPGSSVCYLVTELAAGGSLRRYVERELLLEEIALLLLPVARALDAAHTRGIVHRDVKPDNILLDRREQLVIIKLMDFGVALAADEPRITTDNSVSGSIAYMAPEQLAAGTITPASDIWSLGITFVELAQGKHPFSERQIRPLVNQVLTMEPRLAGEGCTPELVEVVHRCLQRERGQRYPDGAAVVRALEEALAAVGIERPDHELQQWARDPGHRDELVRRLAARPARAPRRGRAPDPRSAPVGDPRSAPVGDPRSLAPTGDARADAGGARADAARQTLRVRRRRAYWVLGTLVAIMLLVIVGLLLALRRA